MKQRMRRISALLLVVLMCVGSIVPAFAATSANCPGVDKYGETIPHTLANCPKAEKVKDVPAQCGEEGYTIYECPECGEFFADNFVDSVGSHDWVEIYKAPTCEEDGYTQYICYNCGDDRDPYGDGKVYDENPDYDYLGDLNGSEPGLGHIWSEPEDGVLDTCTDEATCERCGEEWSDGAHDWSNVPTIVTEPTHTAKGKAKYTCKECGESKTITVEKANSGVKDSKDNNVEHDWIYYAQLDPTCTDPGVSEGWRCSICGLTYSDNGAPVYEPSSRKDKNKGFEAIAKLGDHEYGDITDGKYPEWWTVVLNTCTTAGYYIKTCKVCGEQGTAVNLPATGHSYQHKIYRAATTAEIIALTAEKFDPVADDVNTEVDESTTDGIWLIVKGEDGKYGDPVYTDITDETNGWYTWTGDFQDVRSSWEDADCGITYGYDYYSCKYCHQTTTVTHKPGHQWVAITEELIAAYEEAGLTDLATLLEDHLSDAPHCTNEYTATYVCVRPGCIGKVKDIDTDHVSVEVLEDPTAPSQTILAHATIKTMIMSPTGHNIAEKTIAPNCQNEGYTTTRCWNEGCDYAVPNKDKYNVVPAVPTAHNFVEVDRTDATCVKEGEVVYECDVEGCTEPTKHEVLQKIAHVVDPDVNPTYNYATSCTEKSKVTYTCSGCAGKIVQDVAARYSAHSYYEVNETNIKKGYVTVIAPSCAASGTNGYYIAKCKNLTARNDANNPCQHTQKTGTIPFVKGDVTHHVAATPVKLDTPSKYCTGGDLWQYTCVCGDFKAINPDSVPTFDKHSLTDVEGMPETCLTNGYTDHKACTRMVNALDESGAEIQVPCAYTEGYEVINKLEDGTKHTGKIYRADAVKSTCSEYGWYEGYKCDRCNWYVPYTVTETDTYGRPTKFDFDLTADVDMVDIREPKEDHDTVLVDRALQSCEQFEYNHYFCTKCESEWLQDYLGDLGGHYEIAVPGDDATCVAIGWEDGAVKCVAHEKVWVFDEDNAGAAVQFTGCACKYYGADNNQDGVVSVNDELVSNLLGDWVEYPEAIPMIPHYDADGEFTHVYGLEVQGSATAENVVIERNGKLYAPCNAGATRDRVCLECGNTILKPDAGDTETLLDDGHDWAITNYPATCQAYSYVLMVCKTDGCTASMMVTDGATYADHTWGRWEIKVQPTELKTGLSVRRCQVRGCTAKEETVLPMLSNLDFHFEIDNAVVSKAPLTNSGILALTIKTDAEDLLVWGLRLKLTYDATTMTLLPEKTVFHNDAFVGKVNENVEKDVGVTTILSSAPVNNGETADITLDGKQDYVTLYFQIASDAEDYVEFFLTTAEVADKGQNYINILAEGVEYDNLWDTVYTLGDVNRDGAFTVTDAKDMILLITGEAADPYSSFADIDQDGEVTLADFAALEEYLLGKITYKQMVEGVRAADLTA